MAANPVRSGSSARAPQKPAGRVAPDEGDRSDGTLAGGLGDPREVMAHYEAVQAERARIERQLAMLESLVQEASQARQSLAALRDGVTDAFVPLGAGVHVPGRVTADKVIVPLGAGYAVETDLEDAVAKVTARLDDQAQRMARVAAEADRLAQAAAELESVLSSLQADMV